MLYNRTNTLPKVVTVVEFNARLTFSYGTYTPPYKKGMTYHNTHTSYPPPRRLASGIYG